MSRRGEHMRAQGIANDIALREWLEASGTLTDADLRARRLLMAARRAARCGTAMRIRRQGEPPIWSAYSPLALLLPEELAHASP